MGTSMKNKKYYTYSKNKKSLPLLVGREAGRAQTTSIFELNLIHAETALSDKLLFSKCLLNLELGYLTTTYRIDHGFEMNIRGLAEDIYWEIHGLSYLDNATLTWEVHEDTFWIFLGII